MTVRQFDEAAIARWKMKARAQRTSVEALARQAIHREAEALTREEELLLAVG